MTEEIKKAKSLVKKLILDEAEFLASKKNQQAKTKKSNKGYNKILDTYRETYKAKYGVFPALERNRFNAVIGKALSVVDDYELLIKLAVFFITEYSTFSFVNKHAYPYPVLGGFSVFIEKIYQEYTKRNATKERSDDDTESVMPWSINF
jgi:hypothetical protein